MTAKNSTPRAWNLIAPDEATPLKLEQPNTTVVLSDDEAAWFGKKRVAALADVSHSRACTEGDGESSN